MSTTTMAKLPPLSTTLEAKLTSVSKGTPLVNLAQIPLVLLIPVATLPQVSTTPDAGGSCSVQPELRLTRKISSCHNLGLRLYRLAESNPDLLKSLKIPYLVLAT